MALTIVEAAKLNPGDVVRTAIVGMYNCAHLHYSAQYRQYVFHDHTQDLDIVKALSQALLDKYKRLLYLPVPFISPLQIAITALLFPTVHPPNMPLKVWQIYP